MKLKAKIGLLGALFFIFLLISCQNKYPTIRIGRPPQSSNSFNQSANVDINRILNPTEEKISDDLSKEEITLEEIGRENPFSPIEEDVVFENRGNELIPFPGPLPELKIESIDLELTGISFSGNKKLAIINHKILKLGDKIEGWEVVFINSDRVVLKNNTDKEMVLFLKK